MSKFNVLCFKVSSALSLRSVTSSAELLCFILRKLLLIKSPMLIIVCVFLSSICEIIPVTVRPAHVLAFRGNFEGKLQLFLNFGKRAIKFFLLLPPKKNRVTSLPVCSTF